MKKFLLASLSLIMVTLLCVLCACDGGGADSKFDFKDLGDSYEFAGRGESTDTDIVIPAEYKGKPVTSIGVEALYYDAFAGLMGGTEMPVITSVSIPDSVTSIGNRAFSNNEKITSIDIPKSVTSIGAAAFAQCTGLTSIVIPDGVTVIDESTFAGCTSLKSVTIPDSVTTIAGGAFSGCTALTTLKLPANLEVIGDNCFADCTALSSITLPDKLTTISENAFSRCTALTEVNVPESVTTLGSNAFSETAEELVVNVSYDSERPEGFAEDWFGGMTGKAMNVSEEYYENVVKPNLARAEELQARMDALLEQYKALDAEKARLNEASKPYQQSGNYEMVREYQKMIRECTEQQSAIGQERMALVEELKTFPSSAQLN